MKDTSGSSPDKAPRLPSPELDAVVGSAAHAELNLEVARRSIVLLVQTYDATQGGSQQRIVTIQME